MELIRWRHLWLVVTSLFYLSGRVCAQSDGAAAQPVETAQDWFQRGVSLSRAAHWSEARAAYLRSLQLEPRVSTYFNLATASLQLQLGRSTLLALDDFAQRADPRIHAEFLAEAARMRAAALDLTGTVVLSGLRVDATVEVDEDARRWPIAKGQEHPISLDPGHHVLVLRAPSHLTSSLEVHVARGGTTRLAPSLSKQPSDIPMRVSATRASSEDYASRDVLLWAGIVAVGVGALAAVLVLTLRSDRESGPPASGGSLHMVFD